MNSFLPWRRVLRRKTTWFSLLVVLVFGLAALLAPWIAPHNPYEWNWGKANLPPMWVNDVNGQGSTDYPLGTDRVGRDFLSRLIYGSRTAFALAMTAVPLAALIGTLLGMVAGISGSRVESAIVMFMDMVQALPGILILVILVLVLRSMLAPTWQNGLLTLVIGFTVFSWVSLARLVNVNVKVIRSRLFVEAATALGATKGRIIFHHVLPNVLHVVLAWIINNIPAVIMLEAVLGYIGVGVTGATEGSEFTVVSWGGLFFVSRSIMNRNPMILILPTLSLMLLSISFVLLADVINEAFQGEQ